MYRDIKNRDRERFTNKIVEKFFIITCFILSFTIKLIKS